MISSPHSRRSAPAVQTLAALAALASWAVTPGCATLFNQVPQHIPVTSDPSGATVAVDGQVYGTTPLELALPVDRGYQVRVEAPGYPAQTRMLMRSASVGFIVLDVVLGLVPLAVDLVTGDLYDLDPGAMHFQFAPVLAAPVQAAPAAAPVVLVPVPDTSQPFVVPAGPPAGGRGTTSSAHCCVNGAYYVCPDAGAVARCAPPQLASCLMGCGSDFNCPDGCMRSYPPDPSACQRTPASDGQCR